MDLLKKIAGVIIIGALATAVYFGATNTGKSGLDILGQEALKMDIIIKVEQDKKAVLLKEIEILNKSIIEKRKIKDNIRGQYNKLRNEGLEYKAQGYIQKVYAGVDTQEGIKEEIKKNSETWDKLEVKRVRIIEIQTGLNKINNNLRNRITPVKSTNALMDTIRNAKLYDTEKTCKVDGKEVSIGAIVYGFVKQEAGYKQGTAGYRTNNRGSLRVDHGVVDIAGYDYVDNSKTWIKYHTVEDGLYHLSYIISEKGYDCNIGRKSIFCYVEGCGAERTAKRISNTNQRYKTFVKNALSY